MGKLGSDDSRAPYLQVADAVLEAVATGDYKPGDRLPTLDALAEDYGVAVGTARSAVAVLRDKGVVVTRHGSGSFIRPDLDPVSLRDGLPRGQSAQFAEVLQLLHEINDRLAAMESRLPAES